MKLDLPTAEALVRLRALPEFQVFLGALGGYAGQKNEILIMKDDVNTDLIRGELRAFATIQNAVDTAPRMVEQLQQPKE